MSIYFHIGKTTRAEFPSKLYAKISYPNYLLLQYHFDPEDTVAIFGRNRYRCFYDQFLTSTSDRVHLAMLAAAGFPGWTNFQFH